MFESKEVFERLLFLSFGPSVKLKQARLIAAGNINQGVFLETSDGQFFLKTNFEESEDIFEKVYAMMHEVNPKEFPSLY